MAHIKTNTSVSVLKIKYIAIGFSGAMAGFGGAFMSMYYAMGWSQDMVAGRGFIALAAQAMGAGEPLGAMLAAMVFGFAQALGIKFSAIGLDSNLASPIPYAVTIIGLVIFAVVRHRSASVQIGLKDYHSGHHVDLLLAVLTAHVRLQQRALGEHGGHALVLHDNGQAHP